MIEYIRVFLRVLVKKLLNLISFPPILLNFGGIKIWGFKEIERNECHSYQFHFLPLKLSNKRMNFLFPSLKLPNKGREEYSKLFFSFYSILSSQMRPKRINQTYTQTM